MDKIFIVIHMYWMRLIMNRNNNDKLYQHLVEMEKLSPRPGPTSLQYSISMKILQINGKLGKSNNVCSKGQRDEESSISRCGNNEL